MELQGLNVESFLAYKQRLIDYLERFLSHLVLAAHEIAMTIQSIDPERIAPLLRRAAERELVDRLMATDEDRAAVQQARSEEHTSELQSHSDLVCRLLLEKKKDNRQT